MTSKEEAPEYFALMFDGRVYAVVRRTGGLLERWSPDRRQWKEALFHWDVFFGKGDVGERQPISAEKAAELLNDGTVLPDMSDGDWDYLNRNGR